MLDFESALKTVFKATPLLESVKVQLGKSHLRVLAEDITASHNLPPWDNSAMDGFAVRAADLQKATPANPSSLQICGESSAGKPYDGKVSKGHAVRIMTGGVLPRGTDAVVPVENTTVEKKNVRIPEKVRQGAFVRRAGEDVAIGKRVLSSGDVISAAHAGLLASLGYRKVRVSRKPVVNMLATGDELTALGQPLGPGMIYNSTSYALSAYVNDAGGTVGSTSVVSDSKKAIRKAIEKSLKCDIFLLTGGVSHGKYDLVARELERAGVDILFHGVNIKPGKPLLFGKRKSTLVFGLPGNPVSTCVTFLQFVRPAVLKMLGSSVLKPLRVRATMEEAYQKKDAKRHFLRGVFRTKGGEICVRVAGNQSSGALSSMVRANCLIVIPEDAHEVKKSDRVEIEILGWHG